MTFLPFSRFRSSPAHVTKTAGSIPVTCAGWGERALLKPTERHQRLVVLRHEFTHPFQGRRFSSRELNAKSSKRLLKRFVRLEASLAEPVSPRNLAPLPRRRNRPFHDEL